MYTLLTCERKFNDPTFTALVRSSAKRATKAVSESVSLSSSISIELDGNASEYLLALEFAFFATNLSWVFENF